MIDSSEVPVRTVYRRLWRYIRRYWARLTLGIVMGILGGGAVFPLLQQIPRAIFPIEYGRLASEPRAKGLPHASDLGHGPHALERIARRLHVTPTDAEGRMAWHFFVLTLWALPAVAAFRALANYLNAYYLRWIGMRVVRDLRDEIFTHLGAQSLAFFGKNDVGQLISRCTNDTTVVQEVISATATECVRAPVEIASAALFVVGFSHREGLLGLVVLAAVAFPLCVIPMVTLSRKIRRHTRAALERISDLVSRMHETFTGIRVVKAFGREAREAARFREMNRRYFRSVIGTLRAELLMTPLMEAIAILLGCGFLAVCYARGVRLYQLLPIGTAAILVYRPVRQIARINGFLQRGAPALQRLYRLLDTDIRIPVAPCPVRVEQFADRVVFDRVWFRYEPEGPDVLRDVFFEIPRGSVVAVVGETGAGKTTLAGLLARFYDPTRGRVLLDGHDLRDVDPTCLRRMIGVVTQETILFNDTIAYNIAYGVDDASRACIREAARAANAEDFILANPAGYDQVVGEKGFLLSGGERQRIAIARAFLLNPPILILDEAMSALDTVTERLVQEAIARVMANRTVFAIAHRLSTVRHADVILVLDQGRIVERGTHAELYAANGRYRTLCDMSAL